jgi:DNA-binding MarR family transcriptional regulator
MDQVDQILAQWARERPDLDSSPIGVIGRLSRLTRYVERSLDDNFKPFGLNRWTYDVLATLRRSGPPYHLSPTDLFEEMMITSGAMTNRIDRLEGEGLVVRLPDPDDRRGLLVELTPTGLELVDRVVEAHVAHEAQLLRSLPAEERSLLAGLLGRLLESFESHREVLEPTSTPPSASKPKRSDK